MPKPMIRDRDVALWGGVVALTIGSILIYDAYEARGRQRPWITRILPGA